MAAKLHRRNNQIALEGAWTLPHYQSMRQSLAALEPAEAIQRLDVTRLERLDSSAVYLLQQAFGQELLRDAEFSERQQALVDLVLEACGAEAAPAEQPQSAWRQPALAVQQHLAAIGQATSALFQQQRQLLAFLGVTLERFGQTVWRPGRWRVTATVAQMQQIGVNAIPIVALLTFLVGAVVAFLGARVLNDFGASIYTVNLVGFAFLREFAVLLSAILIAGRTASAFTAQLGSMKANEELDALRAQGLDPVEVLVLPRVLAMLICLPALTVLAMVCGVVGGLLVCWVALDISPLLFLHIFARDIELVHFWVGLGKAPVFALVIALIGCLEGFKVAGSAQSVGEHTTSSVVQSIFMVILLDALFAMFFLEMSW